MHEPKKISLSIDGEVWRRFKEYVLNKHGRLYGVLGEEVSVALEMYLLTQSKGVNALFRLVRTTRRFNKSVSSILAEIDEAEVKTLSEFGVV